MRKGPRFPPPPIAEQQSKMFSLCKKLDFGVYKRFQGAFPSVLASPVPVNAGIRHREQRMGDFPLDLCELQRRLPLVLLKASLFQREIPLAGSWWIKVVFA